MIKLLFRNILIGIILLSSLRVGAQESIRFDNITINQGLSQSKITCIIQDNDGFMWFGTQDGLNKFDGYSFKVYKYNPQDTSTISNNEIITLFIDDEGNLWIGTQHGLNRYNPYTDSFIRYKYRYKKKKKSFATWVTSISQDNEGALWVGTKSNGLYKINLKTAELKRFHAGEDGSISSNNIKTIYRDKDDNLWIGTINGGVVRYLSSEGNFKSYFNVGTTSIGKSILCINENDKGNLLIGTTKGLFEIINKNTNPEARQVLKDINNLYGPKRVINNVLIDDQGAIWLANEGDGLWKIRKGRSSSPVKYKHDDHTQSSLISNNVLTLYKDSFGTIWVGTHEGISKFDKQKQGFKHITSNLNEPGGLLHRNVWYIHERKNGLIWIGNREGVSRYNRKTGKFKSFTRKANNPLEPGINNVLSAYFESDNVVWLGFIDGLYKLILNQETGTYGFIPIKYKDNDVEANDNKVYWLHKDKNNFLWIATREGLSRMDIATKKYEFFQNDPEDPNSLPNNEVRYVMEDKKGQIWLGTRGGLCKVIIKLDEKEKETISFKSYRHSLTDPYSISNNEVFYILEAQNGAFWLGTYGGGLNMFDPKSGKFHAYKEEDGLANNVVYSVLDDEIGNLWLSTNNGISKFNTKTKKFKNYKVQDGLQSNEFNAGAAFKNQKGELFFGGINGINIFHPKEIKNNDIAPKVVFTGVFASGTKQNLLKSDFSEKDNVLVLDHEQNNLTIEFVGLHYLKPERNQYKFILEGVDEKISEPQKGRSIHYANLSPSTYTFKIYGANGDGKWSTEPTVLTIIIEAPFWQTWWFRIIAGLFIVAMIFTINRIRINAIRAQKLKLEQLVEERTRQLISQKEKIEHQKEQIEKQKQKIEQQKEKVELQKSELQSEKEKVEGLLLNVLPEETAEELKSKGKATARSYRQVTVMFTDFVGFTKIAENMRPGPLVEKLDWFFTKFDEIIEKHKIEKIKTVGDAYMCAGGVPIRDKENPVYTVLAGLEIQMFMQEHKEEALKEGRQVWETRIGVNTGEITAGVIGTKRFAYDVWGNTVNVAQRMETSSEPGKVNISGKTHELIEPYFQCTYRGKVKAKNKGFIDMYYVDSIKPPLSKNGEGIEPNDAFWELVNLHIYSSINYKKAERYIMKELAKKLSPHLHYHGIHHTHDVCDAVERIAIHEGITGEELFLLKSAATYHDAGFVEQYDSNEPIGVRMAQEILPKYGYTDEQIDMIAELIHATTVPHNPKNLLQQIICDADLDYLGRDDFHPIADTLRRELREHGKINSDRKWDELQVMFLTQHKYFTKTAINIRQEKKEKHLQEIKERLAKDDYVD